MANIGRASNTIEGGAVEDHLRFCAVEATEPVLAGADTVAAWIGDMFDRPRQRSAKAPLHPETGLANATDARIPSPHRQRGLDLCLDRFGDRRVDVSFGPGARCAASAWW
ncbi:hypothetical protein EJ357_02370 [Streptomyces cyaneochromogenes]|uniref:Uncharacterized protein n=1 Tax=Streptomyces cyaneochromogenes TaxID=2496836 RepID=A0A3Q9EP86_9ACTN|nr:hypothetical protein [Streptomyces cyaneochromogenes]AZQ32433.1 hypothetical protein EJ357_02370 [Streptomyces cyaneochromogenes]